MELEYNRMELIDGDAMSSVEPLKGSKNSNLAEAAQLAAGNLLVPGPHTLFLPNFPHFPAFSLFSSLLFLLSSLFSLLLFTLHSSLSFHFSILLLISLHSSLTSLSSLLSSLLLLFFLLSSLLLLSSEMRSARISEKRNRK